MPMRHITSHKVNGCNEAIEIRAIDEPGSGGANHLYAIVWRFKQGPEDPGGGLFLNFQNGPAAESGVNGITHEALLAVLVDRLECFQNGPFANEWNQSALWHLRKAMEALHDRTLSRVARGVEGTHTV